MFKILDTLKVGDFLSITVEGNCSELKNGSNLKDRSGNVYNIISIGMMQLEDSHDISKKTSMLISPASINIGEELFIA